MGLNAKPFLYASELKYDNNVRSKKKIGRETLKRIIILLLIGFLIQTIVPNAIAKPVMYEHHVVMIQGDDPKTTEDEPDSHIMARERFFFLIPWNESWIEVPVPKDAISISIDHIIYTNVTGWIPGDYSTYWNPSNPPHKHFKDMEDMSCCVGNFYEWGFPTGANRNFTVSTHLETDSDFNRSFDEIRSDDIWNFSSPGLKLKNGEVSGDYFSRMTKMGINISKVEMSWNAIVSQNNFTIHISNNNGTDWLDIKEYKDEVVNFTTQGNELLWKINMTQDIELNNTPILTDLWVNVTYTPQYNDIILQLDYVLEKRIDTNKFEFTMDLYKDQEDGIAPIFLIYINKDNNLESSGVPISLHDTQIEYPDKNAYIFMGGSFSPEATITIREKEEGEFPFLLLLVLILIILCIVIFLVTRAMKKEDFKPIDAQETETTGNQIENLKQKKEGLLKAIKKLDEDFEEGLLDEETHKELKGSYKKKAAEIMKQMDTLSPGTTVIGAISETSSERETLLERKESILKSIKKLDTDFKEGLLDEKVYKELRADYKRKAADLMKELDANQ